MSHDDKHVRTTILQAVGMAQATEKELDVAPLASGLDVSAGSVSSEIEQLERAGLMIIGDPGEPPMLRTARQFLAAKGDVPWAILHFLPQVIYNLHARKALIDAGIVLVDEFRYQHLLGDPVAHARQLVPHAFEAVVDEALALDLYAAAVALMARLSDGHPAGCIAEEILAVALIEHATFRMELRVDEGELSDSEASAASAEMRGLFELFGDDDILNMFEMEEPADTALASHDSINVQMGVVDQRAVNWFTPFGPRSRPGYLDGE